MSTKHISIDVQRLRELFDRVVGLSPDERQSALAEADATAEEREKLRALLAADEAASVLDVPVDRLVDEFEDMSYHEALIGKCAGPYRLLRVLGRGGSSVVYRAVRTVGGVEQIVALKLLESGLRSQESRRRFQREQAILTQLSHPNIARFIDAGITDAGVPYIVMEEAGGPDLIAYAEANALQPEQRLRLLVDVCRAVDAAHRALIVHRDIKPSNVLVAADGCVKVLDFGIAKLLDDAAPKTATQHIVLTPGYAAPEQYASGLVRTSADVYALGVLAGELLIGVRLKPDAVWPDQDDPVDPDWRRRWSALDSDLLNILRTALAQEPDQRYASAGHLADDIGRYLKGEPVAAHPQSTWYRLRKFVARHRGMVLLIVALVLGVCISVIVALRQTLQAHAAASEATTQAARANSMRDFLFDAFSEAEPTRPQSGKTTILEVVDRALSKAQSAARMDPRAKIELQTRLAEVVGAQGELERSGVLLVNARDEARRVLGPDDALALEVERSVERNLYFQGKYAAARAAVDELTSRAAASSDELRIQLLRDSASISVKMHEPDRAVRDARKAVAMSGEMKREDLLRESLKTLGSALLAANDPQEAVSALERELTLGRAQFGQQSDQVSAILSGLSRAYRKIGNLDEAERCARDALAIDRKIYAGDHWIIANHLNALGVVLVEKRDLDGALSTFQESLRINEAVLGENHPDLAIALENVASVDLAKEDYAAAWPLLRRALSINVASFGERHWQTAFVRADYGVATAMLDRSPASGLAELEQAIADLRAADERDANVLGRALEKRVRLALALGDTKRADELLDELASVSAEAKERTAYWSGRTDCLRGEAFLLARHAQDALTSLEKCGAALASADRPEPALQVEQKLLLARALAMSGDVPRARSIAEDARARLGALPYPTRHLRDLEARLHPDAIAAERIRR